MAVAGSENPPENTGDNKPPGNTSDNKYPKSNPTDDEKKRKDKIRTLVDNVSNRLQAGIENGLFEQKTLKEKDPKWEDIHNLISEARESLDKNLEDAESKQEKALETYFIAINHAGAKWRFSGLYAGHIWIFLVGILAGIFAFYVSGIENQLVDPHGMYSLKISPVAIDATAWGIIGSVLRGMWWLRFNVARSNYRKGWTLHYLSSPFIGGILGAVVYILILGGLVSVSSSGITPTNSLAIIPIAAFAGFNWEWAIKLFQKIEQIIDSGNDSNSGKDDGKS